MYDNLIKQSFSDQVPVMICKTVIKTIKIGIKNIKIQLKCIFLQQIYSFKNQVQQKICAIPGIEPRNLQPGVIQTDRHTYYSSAVRIVVTGFWENGKSLQDNQ